MAPWSRIVRQRLQAAHRRAEERAGLRRMKLRTVKRERILAWSVANAWIAKALSALADNRRRSPRIPYPPLDLAPPMVRLSLCRLRRRMLRAARLGAWAIQVHAHVLGLADHYGNRRLARALGVTPVPLAKELATSEAIRRRTDHFAPASRSSRSLWLIEARRDFETGSDVLGLLAAEDATTG